MQFTLQNVGKKYTKNWILRQVSFNVSSSESLVLIGKNGSGKSTLLQLIAGNILPNEGAITWLNNNKTVSEETKYKYISIAAPYLEIPEELTFCELIDFQRKFKPFINNLSTASIIEICNLEKASKKHLKYYSSGMKQRVKLALAILADTPLLLLDEPCSNLDNESVKWYADFMNTYKEGRTIVVCSNEQLHEYFFCNQQYKLDGL